LHVSQYPFYIRLLFLVSLLDGAASLKCYVGRKQFSRVIDLRRGGLVSFLFVAKPVRSGLCIDAKQGAAWYLASFFFFFFFFFPLLLLLAADYFVVCGLKYEESPVLFSAKHVSDPKAKKEKNLPACGVSYKAVELHRFPLVDHHKVQSCCKCSVTILC
jgi:hypothetical protein